jgi:hypothetical protein
MTAASTTGGIAGTLGSLRYAMGMMAHFSVIP